MSKFPEKRLSPAYAGHHIRAKRVLPRNPTLVKFVITSDPNIPNPDGSPTIMDLLHLFQWLVGNRGLTDKSLTLVRIDEFSLWEDLSLLITSAGKLQTEAAFH